MMNMQARILKQIDSIKEPPMAISVIQSILDLSKETNVDPHVYAEVIKVDPALSSKFLSYVNSSYFSPVSTIQTVDMAVLRLGIVAVPTLAIGFFLKSLHNVLQLPAVDARACWHMSLYKATAAKLLAQANNPRRKSEIFILALLQDIGFAAFLAKADDPYRRLLKSPYGTVKQQLLYEDASMGMCHAQAGKVLAERFELPSTIIEAIARHHQGCDGEVASLDEFTNEALGIASLIPHDLQSWKPLDIQFLTEKLEMLVPETWVDAGDFISDVHAGFIDTLIMLGEYMDLPRCPHWVIRPRDLHDHFIMCFSESGTLGHNGNEVGMKRNYESRVSR